MKRPIPWSAIVAALVVATVTCGPALREDEFRCEEAVAHLQKCCPGGFAVDARFCRYTAGSCGDQAPALPARDSECIASLSCEEIVSHKICERAASSTNHSPDTGTTAVCP